MPPESATTPGDQSPGVVALTYASRGWPVHPLKPREKLPLTKWRDEASTDPDAIRAWWEKWPTANVGLVTGIAFDVLDIDGDAGRYALAAQVAKHGPLNPGPSVETPGGGLHLYFLPAGIGNKAGLLDHVDYRGRGGYVVAPPSIHPNGGAYEWADPDAEPPRVRTGAHPRVKMMAHTRFGSAVGEQMSTDRVDRLRGPSMLEPVDAWLRELLEPPTPARRPLRPVSIIGEDAYVAAAIEGEVNRVRTAPIGTRNGQLNIASFSLGQLVGAGRLDQSRAVAELYAAGIAAGLGDQETVRTIRSGLESGIARPREARRA